MGRSPLPVHLNITLTFTEDSWKEMLEIGLKLVLTKVENLPPTRLSGKQQFAELGVAGFSLCRGDPPAMRMRKTGMDKAQVFSVKWDYRWCFFFSSQLSASSNFSTMSLLTFTNKKASLNHLIKILLNTHLQSDSYG